MALLRDAVRTMGHGAGASLDVPQQPEFATRSDIAFAYIFETCMFVKQPQLTGPTARLLRSRMALTASLPNAAKVAPGWACLDEFAGFMRTACDSGTMLLPADCDDSPWHIRDEAWRKFVVASGLAHLAEHEHGASVHRTVCDIHQRIGVHTLGIDPAVGDGKKLDGLLPSMRYFADLFPDMQHRAEQLEQLMLRLVQSCTFAVATNPLSPGESAMGFFCGEQVLECVIARCRAFSDVQLAAIIDHRSIDDVAEGGRRCAHCRRTKAGLCPDAKLKKCSGCASVYYCCREHQLEHWKHGGHKQRCAELAQQKESTQSDAD